MLLVIKMNKKILAIICAIVIIVAAVVTVSLTMRNKDDAQQESTTTTVPTSVEVETHKVSETHTMPSVSVSEIELDDMSTTDEDATKAEVDFVTKDQWWYYFDIQNREAYAFHFDDEMNVEIAFFNSSNIDSEDAKYFTGNSTYTIENGKIIMKYLPDALTIKSFELTIKDNKLFSVDDKLAPHDDLSVDYPVGYFMVLDKIQ